MLVIVTGPPGAGKTTIARYLAGDLGLPLLTKDELKELLADALQVEGLEWSRRVGGASFELLAFLAGRLVGSGVSLVIEANFDPERASPVYRRLDGQFKPVVLQIVCPAEPEVLLRRYDHRAASGARRQIHHDTDPSVRQRVNSAHGPLDLAGPIIEVDTTELESLDLKALVTVVRAAILSATAPGAGDQPGERHSGHEGREPVWQPPAVKERG